VLYTYMLPWKHVLTGHCMGMGASLTPNVWLLGVMLHCSLLKPHCPKKPTGLLLLILLQGGLPITSLAALMNGTTMPHWLWYLSFHFGHHSAFVPSTFGLALLLSSCSLLRAVNSPWPGPVVSIPLLACFSSYMFPAILTSTSLWDSSGVHTLHAPDHWAALEPGPVRLSTTSR
jgi:hypothetical protein